jgi:hypothetical protein
LNILNSNKREAKMKIRTIAIACALIGPLAIAQTTTTVTQETVTTTQKMIMGLDSTHVMVVKSFAPGDKISVETAPDTNPLTIRLDHAIAYVDTNGNPISPSSIDPGAKVRLEFTGPGPDRMVVRVVLVSPR